MIVSSHVRILIHTSGSIQKERLGLYCCSFDLFEVKKKNASPFPFFCSETESKTIDFNENFR